MAFLSIKEVVSRAITPAAAVATVMGIVYFETMIPIVLKTTVAAALALVGYASWTGYRQNKGVNGEWPFNLALTGACGAGAIVLVASLAL
ncbi:hypothetical protein [Pinisolibacter aquiterrae]|uniref:hypothetical protein n=1 Tax=Pinisolibacter aquiterrae TaxID=2815579 RepID=UPI001C3C8EAA|nr:hypothetical protein [Pinisolibacter aquiterrae]MBV5263511.1 hypothetical protein [Pinisolibacter aquiterrae]MCC8237435.1 hypothetical protein [Pinisolibacter aquiterrae]